MQTPTISQFWFHEDIFRYDFGPSHPLKPERLRRLFVLLERYADLAVQTAPQARVEDLLRVHSGEYVDAVRAVDLAVREGTAGEDPYLDLRSEFGFWGDNPPFLGIWEASLAYAGATVKAAEAVRDGASLAFGIGGGLHHALRSRASGFCIFNDCAIGCSILRDRFERVAYVDIDVHHGDGVQWIFYDDPSVLTYSIHEEGRSLWPGTGGVEETGAAYSSLNVPVEAETTADVWLDAFERTALPALEAWRPQAIVLQMGADTHFLDPLAHVNSNQQAWLGAVKRIQELALPLVALGGGGYNLATVPRMWASGCLTLSGIPYEDAIPEEAARQVGASTFSDHQYPFQKGGGRAHADQVVEHLARYHLPNLASS